VIEVAGNDDSETKATTYHWPPSLSLPSTRPKLRTLLMPSPPPSAASTSSLRLQSSVCTSSSSCQGPALAQGRRMDSEGGRHFALFASARALCFDFAIFITALGSSSRETERKLVVATNVMLGFRGHAPPPSPLFNDRQRQDSFSHFDVNSHVLCRINRDFSEHRLSDSPPTINVFSTQTQGKVDTLICRFDGVGAKIGRIHRTHPPLRLINFYCSST